MQAALEAKLNASFFIGQASSTSAKANENFRWRSLTKKTIDITHSKACTSQTDHFKVNIYYNFPKSWKGGSWCKLLLFTKTSCISWIFLISLLFLFLFFIFYFFIFSPFLLGGKDSVSNKNRRIHSFQCIFKLYSCKIWPPPTNFTSRYQHQHLRL